MKFIFYKRSLHDLRDLAIKSIKWLFSAAIIVSSFIVLTERAAYSQQNLGYWYGGFVDSAPTAYAACQLMFKNAGMDQAPDGESRFIGVIPIDANYATCAWTTYGDLCAAEGRQCKTILPSWVRFHCPYGYIEAGNNRCAVNTEYVPEQPRCSGDNGGRINLEVANPFAINTGAKLETVVDFATTDGLFSITRFYRSTSQIANVQSWRGKIRGETGGWRFNFAVELHLAQDSNLTLYEPTGTALNFTFVNGNSAPITRQTDYRVEFVGTPPTDWTSMLSQSRQWKVYDSQNRTWLLQTFKYDKNSSAQYTVARPIKMTDNNGYEQYFNYTNDDLTSISDNRGRTADIVWRQYAITSAQNLPGYLPIVDSIDRITTPDGNVIKYTYDPPEVVPATDFAQRLTKVEHSSGAGSLYGSVGYLYEDIRFPTFLTGILDERGVNYAKFTYDPSGRVLTSEHAGGTEKYTVAYSSSSNLVTVNVTNPLGKITNYVLERSSDGLDIKLNTINGVASASCAAGVAGLTYGTDNFIASSTDEEGRKTTYVRDALGRPTSITRGAP